MFVFVSDSPDREQAAGFAGTHLSVSLQQALALPFPELAGLECGWNRTGPGVNPGSASRKQVMGCLGPAQETASQCSIYLEAITGEEEKIFP